MGVRRRVTTFSHRDLTTFSSRNEVIGRAVRDRSAVVRRVGLAGVIRHMLGSAEGRVLATMLVADRSPSVRERAEFILRAGNT